MAPKTQDQAESSWRNTTLPIHLRFHDLMRTKVHHNLPKTNLLDLPVELIEKIADYTRPEGFQAFVLSCKAVHRVAKHRLLDAHYDMKLCWSRILPIIEDDPELLSPLHTCLSIYRNPLIGPYVETVELHDMDECTGVTCTEVVGLQKIQGFKDFLVQMDIWSKCKGHIDAASLFHQVRPWCELRGESEMGFACMCLLLLLPNLKDLYFRDVVTTGYDMFCPIIKSAYAGLLPPGYHKPFQNLTRLVIEIDENDLYDEDGDFRAINLIDVAPLLLLPSLKFFRTGRLHSNHSGLKKHVFRKWPYRNHVPNLQELDARYNWVDSVAMEKFLAPMAFLRRLYWVHETANEVCTEWHVGDFVKSVAKVAGHRLEAFSICQASGNEEWRSNAEVPLFDGWVEDFKGFKNLKYLEFSVEFLRGHDKAKPQRTTDESGRKLPKLVDILPQTIKEVRINMDLVNTTERKTLFEDLAEKKEAILPHLREVTLSHANSKKTDISVRLLRKKLERSGVDLALEGHQDPHLHYLGRDFETRKFLHDIESREPCL